MKRLRKLCDNKGVELSEDIIMEILHLLPSKSPARFKCVSKCWQNYIAGCRSQRWRPQPDFIGIFYQTRKHSQIGFFFESNNNHMHDLDESVNFLNRKVYIVASSNGFLLCKKDRKKPRDYYVYNPATRQYSSLPKTLFCMEGDLAIGFICKVDDPNKDVISFTIVRYEIRHHWDELQFTVTIGSFFSETNVWTFNSIILDAPLRLYPLNWDTRSSASSDGVIDGVFCWLDQVERQITVYDSVYKSFGALELPEEIETTYNSYLGLSGGDFYFALDYGEEITVWKLESNIRSRVAVWVVKYDADVAATVLQCPEAFGLGGDTLRVEAFGITGSLCIEVQNMVIHPVFPHIFYLDVRGKVISYDLKTDTAEFVYDFKEPWWKTLHYKLFPYEWHQWPRLLSTVN